MAATAPLPAAGIPTASKPASTAASPAAARTWIAPALAAALGASAAVLTTWWIVASQALDMTVGGAGF